MISFDLPQLSLDDTLAEAFYAMFRAERSGIFIYQPEVKHANGQIVTPLVARLVHYGELLEAMAQAIASVVDDSAAADTAATAAHAAAAAAGALPAATAAAAAADAAASAAALAVQTAAAEARLRLVKSGHAVKIGIDNENVNLEFPFSFGASITQPNQHGSEPQMALVFAAPDLSATYMLAPRLRRCLGVRRHEHPPNAPRGSTCGVCGKQLGGLA